MRTQQERETAKRFRLLGKSYGEISAVLGISKSTIHQWLSGLEIPKTARNRIQQRVYGKLIKGLIKRNKRQTAIAITRARRTQTLASKKILAINSRELLIAGAVLYWAEGYKRLVIKNGREVTYHVVSLTNSDSDLVKLFLRFLKEYCEIPNHKIKANLRLFEHQIENELLNYWHKETGIPMINFTKTYYGKSISSKNKRPYNRLPHGVIQIRVGSTSLFHQIIGYIEGLRKLV